MDKNQIKKFVSFGFNFGSDLRWMDRVGWHCSADHMRNKFRQAQATAGTFGAMFYFFSELDDRNQQALIDFVNENFEG